MSEHQRVTGWRHGKTGKRAGNERRAATLGGDGKYWAKRKRETYNLEQVKKLQKQRNALEEERRRLPSKIVYALERRARAEEAGKSKGEK